MPDTAQRILEIKSRAERDIAPLSRTTQAEGDRDFLLSTLEASEAENARLREALTEALEESGCDGDLCAHRWHELARTALQTPEEPK